MIVECPGCKRRYDVSGRPPGTRARCRCGETFTLRRPDETALALKCPNCGGNAGADATRCGYCDAELAIRACPRCFGKLFLGTKFCPQCGASSDAPARALADGDAAPRHCPRCDGGGEVQLEGRLTHDMMLDCCPQCAGIFLCSDVLERILAERRYRETPAGDGNGDGSAAPTTSGARGGQVPFYIRCPDCETSMARRLFAPQSGVVVDVCKDHGTWLDASELERLIAFVQGGGLDNSRPATSFQSTGLRAPQPPSDVMKRANRLLTKERDAGFFDDAVDVIRALFG